MLALAQNELDAGPRRPGAERFCAVTGVVKPVDEMIRFVVGPDGIVPDLKHKLPGRGLWITATRAALSEAIARKLFARGFKRDVRAGTDLLALTEGMLTRAALDALGIAAKAGTVAAGFAKTEHAIAHKPVVALIEASDGASTGTAKLRAALRQHPDADEISVIAAFSTAQLDLALGRSNVVHAALLAGSASDMFITRFRRLERFRTDDRGTAGNTPAKSVG